MQLGFVGLGRMGGNMVHRIHRDSDHEVVAFDFSEDAVSEAEGHGATGVGSLEELVEKLDKPRAVWVMVPAGDPTEQTVAKLGELLDEGDMVIDGGNTRWSDDKRRAQELRPKGIDYVDVGTSGGVWGLQVGYCMMVGGPDEAVERLAPILDVLAPPATEEHGPGWRHFGPPGAGHPCETDPWSAGSAGRSRTWWSPWWRRGSRCEAPRSPGRAPPMAGRSP